MVQHRIFGQCILHHDQLKHFRRVHIVCERIYFLIKLKLSVDWHSMVPIHENKACEWDKISSDQRYFDSINEINYNCLEIWLIYVWISGL